MLRPVGTRWVLLAVRSDEVLGGRLILVIETFQRFCDPANEVGAESSGEEQRRERSFTGQVELDRELRYAALMASGMQIGQGGGIMIGRWRKVMTQAFTCGKAVLAAETPAAADEPDSGPLVTGDHPVPCLEVIQISRTGRGFGLEPSACGAVDPTVRVARGHA